jgi:hypothetical protein
MIVGQSSSMKVPSSNAIPCGEPRLTRSSEVGVLTPLYPAEERESRGNEEESDAPV